MLYWEAAPGADPHAATVDLAAPPPVPWLAVTLTPLAGIALPPEAVHMLGDLERCIFWALAEVKRDN